MTRLMLGLFIYGLALAMVIKAQIGVPPWDVFAQGISVTSGITYGQASIVVSVIVLLAWIPLKVKPGIGSVLNAVCIGLFADLWMPYVPTYDNYLANLAMFLFGMATVAFATGLYISAKLGSGPRDGLMLGTQRLLGWPFWQVRTMYEATVLTIGWLLGGQVREGTLIFAICIGYLMQASLKFFKVQK
jgi:uncharacterized membrane protein YczE